MKPQTKFILSQYYSLFLKGTILPEKVVKAFGKFCDRGLLTHDELKGAISYLETLKKSKPTQK